MKIFIAVVNLRRLRRFAPRSDVGDGLAVTKSKP
ncbi:MAG: hypothetical protein RLZZ470_1335, partial [Pseudomonadota bacterium]